MRAALAYLAVALVLAAAGTGLWTTGRLQQRLVAARQKLLVLQYDAPLQDYDYIEESTRLLTRVPWVADEVAQIRPARALSAYWEGDFASLGLERDAAGALIEQDPAVIRLAANAAFRAARAGVDTAATVQRLNDVLALYAEALRKDPQFDVAYNFEVVARTRDALARPSRPGRPSADALGSRRIEQTIHGRQGGPPDQTDMREFKIIVPQRSDERSQQPDAGQGGKKQRKG